MQSSKTLQRFQQKSDAAAIRQAIKCGADHLLCIYTLSSKQFSNGTNKIHFNLMQIKSNHL